ncbi:elongation factor G [Microlunatus speluncae]|uniref:elongation factor G n=1 Tax=Microlunatus speluncae TaxID=2594267 RepID=UPI00126611CA|nr:TetM/TetW/TetO/TetS family tetracycline resistance ribosomal protection protein [Microlunatus speluncae]
MHRAHSPETAGPADPSDRPAPSRRWLNLGVLAHVDAGKTSLTEALLHAGGAVDQLGRVDDGTTQTDTLALERRRGITIRTAVASFAVGDVTVNLVDTPGHPDFIAEVDRSLAVLDGAIVVLSAVEGVQAQTIVLFRALRRLGIPAVFMINKIDRSGADPERVLAGIRRRLTAAVVPLGVARDQGTAAAALHPHDWTDPALAEATTAMLAELDDAVLAAWVDQGRALDPASLWAALGRLTRRGTVHPVLFGSAVTGAGVPEVITTATSLLPAESADAAAPMTGQVFKIERATDGSRVCSVRLRAGTLGVRDPVRVGEAEVGRVTRLEVHEPGGAVTRDRALAGQIARVHGLTEARLGDRLGVDLAGLPELNFAPPALETTVQARDHAQQLALHTALAELADRDPLIRLRPDADGASRISVYGEVQQQVIADTLALEHGIEVDFRSTMIICVERPAGAGSAVVRMGDPDHFLGAGVGLTVEPNRSGAGLELILDLPLSQVPMHVYSTVGAFQEAMLRYLEEPLTNGPQGWQVTDLRVTVTEMDFVPPGPSAAHARLTAQLVVAEAVRQAGTIVCEPVDRFRLETPADALSGTLGLLGRHRAIPGTPLIKDSLAELTGTIPTAELDAVRRQLHSATHGEGLLESKLDHYVPRRSG